LLGLFTGDGHPAAGESSRRQPRDGELAGIVSKPVSSSPRVGGILEGAGVDQRPVGPAAGAVVDVADRLARLEGRRRVSVRKLHAAPVRRAVGRAGWDCLPVTTTARPFFRDSAASPINDITTGGRHSATTFVACSNLPMFRISNLSASFSRWRGSDQTW
jgi:hypothetical protein